LTGDPAATTDAEDPEVLDELEDPLFVGEGDARVEYLMSSEGSLLALATQSELSLYSSMSSSA